MSTTPAPVNSSTADPAANDSSIIEAITEAVTSPPQDQEDVQTTGFIFQAVKLSGVEIILIIAAGFTIFVILAILAHRQIKRMVFCKNLQKMPVPKLSELPGLDKDVSAKIWQRVVRSGQVDGHVEVWSQFHDPFYKDELPVHYWRAKALDQCNRLLPILYSFGGIHCLWKPMECVDEFLIRKQREFPFNKLETEKLLKFSEIYQAVRFDEGANDEDYYDWMRHLTDGLIQNLRQAREELEDTAMHMRPKTAASDTPGTSVRRISTSSTTATASTAGRTLQTQDSAPTASGRTLLIPRDDLSRVSPHGYERLSPASIRTSQPVKFLQSLSHRIFGKPSSMNDDLSSESLPLRSGVMGRTGPAAADFAAAGDDVAGDSSDRVRSGTGSSSSGLLGFGSGDPVVFTSGESARYRRRATVDSLPEEESSDNDLLK